VLKNGLAFGVYKMEPNVVLGVIRFLLVLPNDVIELEWWNAAP
jgi:hypothetical protein